MHAARTLLGIWSEIYSGEKGKISEKTMIYQRNISLFLNPTLARFQKQDSAPRNDLHYPNRVAIVDDDENDLLMMRLDLEKSHEFICTGMYRSGNEALVEIPKVRPLVVLMDIRMPDMDGRECARRLKVIQTHLKIIFVTGLLDIDTMSTTLRGGADGYLTKPTRTAEFLAMVKRTVGDTYDSTGSTNASPGREPDTPRACSLLTLRENQVMAFLSKGLLRKEIPAQMGISLSAVHKHQVNSYRKLGAHNRTEALNNWRDNNHL